MKDITIDIPIYKTHLRLLVGPDIQKVRKKLQQITNRKRKNEIPIEEADGLTFQKAGELAIIWMRGVGPKFYASLAHELIHASWHILDEVGVDVTANNHEALTYLVGWLFKEITKNQ